MIVCAQTPSQLFSEIDKVRHNPPATALSTILVTTLATAFFHRPFLDIVLISPLPFSALSSACLLLFPLPPIHFHCPFQLVSHYYPFNWPCSAFRCPFAGTITAVPTAIPCPFALQFYRLLRTALESWTAAS